MRIELTKQECRWLADLVELEKEAVRDAHAKTPHPLLELRRDNMMTLEDKLNAAIDRQIERERRNREPGPR